MKTNEIDISTHSMPIDTTVNQCNPTRHQKDVCLWKPLHPMKFGQYLIAIMHHSSTDKEYKGGGG